MISGLQSACIQLWRGAPYWRMSVIGASLFTVLSVIGLWTNPSGVAPSPLPVYSGPPPDPASDARLASYKDAHDEAMKITDIGARCEQMTTAFNTLTPDDITRGRDVLTSTRGRIAAISDGQGCHDSIAQSDNHFVALDQAVAAAQAAQSPKNLQAAATALASLDAFDRSRDRFKSDTAVASQAQAFASELSASQERVASMVSATETLQHDQSPASYLAAAAALATLTDLDRASLSSSEQSDLAIATQAAQSVQDSRLRLSGLAQLLSTAQANQDPQAQQQLIQATSAITPFDEGIASPDQKQMLAQARAAAIAYAWSELSARLATLEKSHQPSDYQPVVAIFTVLKSVPPATLNTEQKSELARARNASDQLSASDDHLRNLVAAAAQWQQNGLPAGDIVLSAMDAVTSFDHARFSDQDRQAWSTVKAAEPILRGPELGLTASTKNELQVFVSAPPGNQFNAEVAASLGNALQIAGFLVTTTQRNAAIIATTSVGSISDPQQDLSGGFVQWAVTAQLATNVTWAVDGSSLFTGSFSEKGLSYQSDLARNQALIAAINAVVGRFSSMTAH